MLMVWRQMIRPAQLRAMTAPPAVQRSVTQGAPPPVYRPVNLRVTPPAVYRPGATSPPAPPALRPSMPPPHAIQPILTVRNEGKKGAEEEEFRSALLPESRQKRKKADLQNVLKSLNGPQFKNLKLQFSKGALTKSNLNQLEAIEVLKQLSDWAADGTPHTFDNWDDAVNAAAMAVRANTQTGGESTAIVTPSTATVSPAKIDELKRVMQKFGDDDEIVAFWKVCDAVCLQALGSSFALEDFSFAYSTNVSMHGGEEESGVKATLHHLKSAAQVIFRKKQVIVLTVQHAVPVGLILGLPCSQFLLTFFKRIVGGSILEGKCDMMQESMMKLAVLLPKVSRPRFGATAITKICDSIKESFWGVEPKKAVKICRELTSAFHVLDALQGLILIDWELKFQYSHDTIAEFDLKFAYSETGPAVILEVESESAMFMKKAEDLGKEKRPSEKGKQPKLTGAEYYAKRWAKKAKMFRSLRLPGEICFMISPHQGLTSDMPAQIAKIAKTEYGVDLNIIYSGGSDALPLTPPLLVNVQPLATTTVAVSPTPSTNFTRQRSASWSGPIPQRSGSGGQTTTRARSGSLPGTD